MLPALAFRFSIRCKEGEKNIMRVFGPLLVVRLRCDDVFLIYISCLHSASRMVSDSICHLCFQQNDIENF